MYSYPSIQEFSKVGIGFLIAEMWQVRHALESQISAIDMNRLSDKLLLPWVTCGDNESHYESEAKCKAFPMTISFVCT